MIRYLLDANAVFGLLNDATSPLAREARRHDPRAVGLSSTVAHELYYGAFKSRRRDDNIARVEALRFEVVPFDKEDARTAGEIRAALAASGSPIGPYDVPIAGQARARGLILVTNNTREFARVGRLHLEDRSSSPA